MFLTDTVDVSNTAGYFQRPIFVKFRNIFGRMRQVII